MPPRRMSHPSRTGKPAPNTKAPAGSYALPGGGPGGADAYPVNTKARGANALARVEQNGTPADKSKVRAAVKSKYPDLPSRVTRQLHLRVRPGPPGNPDRRSTEEKDRRYG